MSKQENGAGSIFKRPNGRWVAVITLGYLDGKPKRKWYSADTRKEVTALLERAKQDRDAGHRLGTKEETVEQFLSYWLDEVAAVRLAPMSLATYRSLVTHHLIPRIGHIHLSRLTAQHIQQTLNADTKSGSAPRTVRLVREVLRGALEQAKTYKLIRDNPAADVEVPRIGDDLPAFLDPEQAKTLLHANEGERLYALYATALFLGLRRGEVLGLRWKDVDFDAGTLQVAQAMQVLDGVITFQAPKTKHSRRLLPLPVMLATILRDHRARQRKERLQSEYRWPRSTSEDLVFVTMDGEPIQSGRLRYQFHQALQRAGLDLCTFHTLRHSCATLLIALNVPLPIVKEIMGHSDIAMTMQYVHALGPGKTQAMDAMATLFQKQAG